jgi:protein-tyrosine phosphatase
LKATTTRALTRISNLSKLGMGVGCVLLSQLLLAGAWHPECDEVGAHQYEFDDLHASAASPVRIFLCSDIRCFNRKLLVTATTESLLVPRPSEAVRAYFGLEARDEHRAIARRIIGIRRYALQGASNFRDLGGIEAADGRRVRWGHVFRSDDLSGLTAADYARLNLLGISLVCDLRTHEERERYPTVWRDGSPVFLLTPVSEDAQGVSRDEEWRSALNDPARSVADRNDLFEQFYVSMALHSASKFGIAIRGVEAWPRASLFHCAAGRDRTGIMAAILLRILGAAHDEIIADYVLSAKFADPATSQPRPVTPGQQPQEATVAYEQSRYIDAVFAAIDRRYGAFDAYRRKALGISDADVARLKESLLEKENASRYETSGRMQ